MVEWKAPHLHWEFNGEHVLFPFIVLTSFPSFLLGSLLLVVICVVERLVSQFHDKSEFAPPQQTRWRAALWRGLLYWIAMVLRLCYMLAAMTFNIGLLLVIATTLAITQFIIEVRSTSTQQVHSFQPIGLENRRHDSDAYFPSHHRTTSEAPTPESIAIKTRPRSKSKPDGIFIHPAESNIARADAMAYHLDLEERKRTELREESDSPWQEGKGRGMARQLLLPSTQPAPPSPPQQQRRESPYQIGDDWDSDNSESDGEQDPAKRRLVS